METNNIYKIYQLMEFFINKYGFNNVVVKELIDKNEVWLTNSTSKDYTIVRISLSSLDNTFTSKSRIDKFIDVIASSLKSKPKFLDIHISNETVTDNELYDTVCIETNYYSGIEIDNIYPGIKNVIHDVKDKENELSSRIASINSNMKSRLNMSKQAIRAKLNISVTNIIMIICIVMYVLTAILKYKGYSSASSMIVLGADYKFFTLGLKQYYRLITYGLLHSSIIHLAMNMYSFYYLGNMVEKVYGKVIYLLILVLSVFVGGLTHGILTDNQLMVGLSGGIYGLLAIYVTYMIKVGAYRNTRFIFLIFLNLMINFNSGVAWQAHLGGAVTGIIFFFMITEKGIDKKLIALLVVLIAVLGYKYVSTNNISPLYLGTDNEVVKVYDDLGLHDYSSNLEEKIYNYYISH